MPKETQMGDRNEGNSQEEYRNLFESVPVGLCITDFSGNVLSINESMTELTGYTLKELSEIGITGIYENRADRKVLLNSLRTKGTLEDFEVRLMGKNSASFWAAVYCRPVKYSGTDAILTTVLNITDRKEVVEALRESNERFRAVMEATTDYVFTKNTDRKYTYVNQAMADLLSTQADELLGKTPEEVFNPEDRDLLSEADRLAFKGNISDDIHALLIRNENRTFHVVQNPLRDSDEQVQGLCGIARDITEYKIAEERQAAYLYYLENIERIEEVIRSTGDLKEMMSEVLQAALEIFGADRAWLLYPCDPDAESWTVPMERTRPAYPGANARCDEIMMLPEVSEVMRLALESNDVQILDYRNEAESYEPAEMYSIITEMHMALHPQIGKAWLFGLHQCENYREWTDADKGLFREVGRRLTVALSSMLSLRELQSSEERFRETIESISDGFFILESEDLIITYFNRAAGILLNRRADDVMDQPFINAFPEASDSVFEHQFRKAFNEKTFCAFETCFADEPYANWYDVRVYPGDNCISVFFQVTTDRKLREKEREESFILLQNVIDGMPATIVVINREHAIVHANESARNLAGSNRELIGLTCHGFFCNSKEVCSDPEHPCPVNKVLETQQPVTVEHVHTDPGGDKRFSHIVAAPIESADGDIIQIILSSRDVTELRRAEAAKLNLERQMLHGQKLESLGVLAGGIAHDFNNILMAILGNADLAMMDLSDTNPAYSNLREIEIAAKRAADLSKQMLAYSGRGKFVIEQVNLNEAIEEITRILEVSISKKASLKLNYSDNLPVIDADPTQIRQIIMNLVTNASEAFADKTGIISITTGAMDCDSDYLAGTYLDDPLPDGRYVYLEVADTGSGMDEATQQKLFDPFFTTKFTGRGLGLSAVLGIVRGHKGAIKVYSEAGGGTLIKVLFPICSTAPASLNLEIADNRKSWTGSGTILLVDDEEPILSIGKEMLERIGFDVITASDGKEALTRFKEHADKVDLVILDLTMPNLDGAEAFEELQRLQPGVRVLVSSGYNEQDVAPRFAGKPLAGFLQKPYIFRELEASIKGILDK